VVNESATCRTPASSFDWRFPRRQRLAGALDFALRFPVSRTFGRPVVDSCGFSNNPVCFVDQKVRFPLKTTLPIPSAAHPLSASAMKNNWLTPLLCVVFIFVATGCGSTRGPENRRRAAGAPQTGTNIPRWTTDASRARDARTKQRQAKQKRPARDKMPRAEKPKHERQERRRPAGDEEVITRGGFR
jgi:hypothetical protein